MKQLSITDHEFDQFRGFLLQSAGIKLSAGKKALVIGRLSKRLRHYGLASFEDYFNLATSRGHEDEKQCLLDYLTTNETFFFREPLHFDFLREEILPSRSANPPLRVWSAAASSGEEAYSIAMVLAEHLGFNTAWSILGTDINNSVLDQARQAKYPIIAKKDIPPHLLKKFCLKGINHESGNLLINRSLRSRVRFSLLNLNSFWTGMDTFDIIFLRNVMIYFDRETKCKLVEKIYRQLKPGGYLFIGRSETINESHGTLTKIIPSIYRRTK